MTTDTPSPRRSRRWMVLLLVFLALLGCGLYVARELKEDPIRMNEEYALSRVKWLHKALVHQDRSRWPPEPPLPTRRGVSLLVARVLKWFGHDPDLDARRSRYFNHSGGSGQDWEESTRSMFGYCFRFITIYANREHVIGAKPLDPGVTGRRSFFMSHNGLIRWTEGRWATTADPVLED